MSYKNVWLTEDEKDYWANYFTDMCPGQSGYVSNRNRWQALTINEEKTIFIKHVDTERDDHTVENFLFFWNSHLFELKLRVKWGEKEIESWKILKMSDYFSSKDGIEFNEEVTKQQDQIFNDLKSSLKVYGEDGLPVLTGYENLSRAIPTIKLDVDGRLY